MNSRTVERGALEQQTRKMCRNPRCGCRLPVPVINPREAFCARGCYLGFYRTRCLVCEAKMVRTSESQLICGKRKCRSALAGGLGFGRYHRAARLISTPKTSIKPGIKSALNRDRAWHIVAGPELSAAGFRFASLPLDPVAAGRVARDTAALREHAAGALIRRHDPPVNLLGGHKFRGAPPIDLSPIARPACMACTAVFTGDGLDIPEFLVRRETRRTGAAAALLVEIERQRLKTTVNNEFPAAIRPTATEKADPLVQGRPTSTVDYGV